MIRVTPLFKSNPYIFNSLVDTLPKSKSSNGSPPSKKSLKTKFSAVEAEYSAQIELYKKKAGHNTFHLLPHFPTSYTADIFPDLSHAEAKEIYDKGLYASETSCKPGRALYDELMLLSDAECPYCCGIGEAGELDHYLPRSNYPQFSAVLENLIPSCSKCNRPKGGKVVTSPTDRIINPYFDHDCFFSERWINAKVIEHFGQCVVEYFFDAPPHWASEETQRATYHFKKLKLAKRLSDRARKDIREAVYTYKTKFHGAPLFVFAKWLLDKSESNIKPVNDKSRLAYKAFAESNWFLDFCDEQANS